MHGGHSDAPPMQRRAQLVGQLRIPAIVISMIAAS